LPSKSVVIRDINKARIPDLEKKVLHEIQANAKKKIDFREENGRVIDIFGFEVDIKKIPESINNLSCLKSIGLWKGDISEIPETLFEIKSLESLSIHDNKIKKIPKSIHKLKNLRVLSITGGLLTEFPDFIGDLENLDILQLDENQIKKIPEPIGNLINLHFLDLNHNRVSKLPDSIGNLPLLRFGIKSNLLTQVPVFITQFSSIWELDFTGNPISNPPKTIGKFKLKEGLKYDAYEVLDQEHRKRSFNQGELVFENAEKPCLTYPGCPYGTLVECFYQRTKKSKYGCDTFGHDCPIFYLMEPITEKISRIPENYKTTQFKESIKDRRWFNNKAIVIRNVEKPCYILKICPYGSLGDELNIRKTSNKFQCKIFPHDCPIFYHFELIAGYTEEDLREKRKPKIDPSKYKKIDEWFK